MKYPAVGDFVVTPAPPNEYLIERRSSCGTWERVSSQTQKLDALRDAQSLAKDAGTKAWTYELDNQYEPL